MIKIPIHRTIPDAVNHLVVVLAKTKRVKPSDITLEVIPRGAFLFNVAISQTKVGAITKAFNTMMFIPN